MLILIYLLFVGAVVAWLLAAVTALRLFPLRRDEFSRWDMIWNGMIWFRADTFTPVAANLHRRFLRAFFGFFACLLLGAIAIVLSQL